jgi:hypothetical protein
MKLFNFLPILTLIGTIGLVAKPAHADCEAFRKSYVSHYYYIECNGAIVDVAYGEEHVDEALKYNRERYNLHQPEDAAVQTTENQ